MFNIRDFLREKCLHERKVDEIVYKNKRKDFVLGDETSLTCPQRMRYSHTIGSELVYKY